MVINAPAAKANFSSAATVTRFLFTCTTYFGLHPAPDLRRGAGSEFIDPPRYRCDFQSLELITDMDHANPNVELLGLDARFERVNALGVEVRHD